ncbi:unnamed protein product [Moneuplotes crassus]|uniref:Uncharacterized protein n=1 Tax=Euplotes crassus TaxID=5936 RepID=A0AAD1X723_EUPCR|nr:unnamed protein product [Moneuplotes crassus]
MRISKQVDETEPDLRAHQCPTQINFQFDSASTKMFDYMTSSKIQPKYIFNKRRVLSNSPVSSRKGQDKSSYSCCSKGKPPAFLENYMNHTNSVNYYQHKVKQLNKKQMAADLDFKQKLHSLIMIDSSRTSVKGSQDLLRVLSRDIRKGASTKLSISKLKKRQKQSLAENFRDQIIKNSIVSRLKKTEKSKKHQASNCLFLPSKSIIGVVGRKVKEPTKANPTSCMSSPKNRPQIQNKIVIPISMPALTPLATVSHNKSKTRKSKILKKYKKRARQNKSFERNILTGWDTYTDEFDDPLLTEENNF